MIREEIKSEMARQGLTISELSRRVGCRRATLSDFLHGKYEMGTGFLEKILKELNIKLVSHIKKVEFKNGSTFYLNDDLDIKTKGLSGPQ